MQRKSVKINIDCTFHEFTGITERIRTLSDHKENCWFTLRIFQTDIKSCNSEWITIIVSLTDL